MAEVPTKKPKALETAIVIDVPFYDVDAMHVVWHGNYVKYLEVARCALMDTLDFNYAQMEQSGYIWPIVDMRIKYIGSALFTQKIKVLATIGEYENRIKIEYVITDTETGNVLTKAYTVQVALSTASKEMLYSTPNVMLEKLGVAND
jgi:acyl-CoA thioester hydrolase